MTTGTRLLDDDGTASMATLLMLSHHALRRDLSRFGVALRQVASGDGARAEALQGEWQSYHATLHGHHTAEDNGIFPDLRERVPALRPVLEGLIADHRRLDPLLERGDGAFADLPPAGHALAVVTELGVLLDAHLAVEEREIIPHLRGSKAFPPPPNDEMAAMYAQGFSWAMHGIAPEVVAEVMKMLPELLTSRLPAAQQAFAARVERVWGSVRSSASRTSVPE